MQSLDSLFFKRNIFAVSPLVVGIVMFLLGLITMIKNRASKFRVSFSVVNSSTLVWLESLIWLYPVANEQKAPLWATIEPFGVAFKESRKEYGESVIKNFLAPPVNPERLKEKVLEWTANKNRYGST